MKTLGKFVLFVVSLVISAWALNRWILKDWNLVWIVLLSIFFHEFAHWFVLKIYGFNPSIVFIPLLGGGTIVDQTKLTFGQNATVAFAGPVANLILFFFGCIMYLYHVTYAIQFVSLNIGLVFINLFPILILDGARLFDAIVDSLDMKRARSFALFVSVSTFVESGVMAFFGKYNFYFVFIGLGIILRAARWTPLSQFSEKAMSQREAKIFAFAYIVIFVFSFVISEILPPFI